MYSIVKLQAVDAEFSSSQMILGKSEVLTLKISFTAKDFFFFFPWNHCFGKEKCLTAPHKEEKFASAQ